MKLNWKWKPQKRPDMKQLQQTQKTPVQQPTTGLPNTAKPKVTPKATKPKVPAAKLNAKPIEDVPNGNLKRIEVLTRDILTRCRNHESEGEYAFGKWLKDQLPQQSWVDHFGNIHVRIGTSSKTLFSAHIDTVHTNQKEETQTILYDTHRDELFVDSDGTCLGADDGTGVWILLQMIDRKIPGNYIFHRGEERGGQGSRWLADTMPSMLSKFDRAVAFDRKGTTDIITHQGTCTASDEFADALAKELNDLNKDFKFEKSPHGSFTDTKSYAKLIPECTNISVGYMHQHGPNESQKVDFLCKLMDALLKVNWEKLPVERNPLTDNGHRWGNTGYSGYNAANRTYPQPVSPVKKPSTPAPVKETPRDPISMEEAEMIVRRYPDIAAALISESDLEWIDFEGHLSDLYMMGFPLDDI